MAHYFNPKSVRVHHLIRSPQSPWDAFPGLQTTVVRSRPAWCDSRCFCRCVLVVACARLPPRPRNSNLSSAGSRPPYVRVRRIGQETIKWFRATNSRRSKRHRPKEVIMAGRRTPSNWESKPKSNDNVFGLPASDHRKSGDFREGG